MARQFSSRNLRRNKRYLFKEQDDLRISKSTKKKVVENLRKKKRSSVDMEVKSVAKKKGIPVSGDIPNEVSSEAKNKEEKLVEYVVDQEKTNKGVASDEKVN